MIARIPKFEPEVIAAAIRRCRGDDEKVATTPLKELILLGKIRITSRYQKAHEMEFMKLAAEHMPAWMQELVTSIFCDSKANACFSLALREWHKDRAFMIGEYFRAAAIFAIGGHNGITLEGPGGSSKGERRDLDPEWYDDDWFGYSEQKE